MTGARAPAADDELVRRAIRARAGRPLTSAVVHGVLAALALLMIAGGGQPLPFALGGAGLAAVGLYRALEWQRLREARSPAIDALLHTPAAVERIAIVDAESGLQVQITAHGATDHLCPPGELAELLAMLARRCPQVIVEDRR